jgi:hypothetical protein
MIPSSSCVGSSPHSKRTRFTPCAYELLQRDGQSRLFGLVRDQAVSPAAALAAGDELIHRLEQWLRSVRLLPEHLHEASPASADALRHRTIENRMQAWAALLALDHAYAAAVESGSHLATPLAKFVDQVLERIESLDAMITAHAPLLRPVISPAERRRWRRLLAPQYREAQLPWLCD